MNSKSITLLVALLILSIIAWSSLSPKKFAQKTLNGYNNKVSKVVQYTTIRQGGSSTYSSSSSSSSSSYSSSRSYSGGSYSYGK